ncbi:GntR family transcriptional regulator, partial [Burkholderia multivorans]
MARTARIVDIPSLGALDRAAGDLSRQLAQALREAVRRGDVRPGDTLPSTRLLAASLQVARGTVVDAYAQLVSEGFLESRAGAGTRVAHALAAPPPAHSAVRRPRARTGLPEPAATF